MKNIMRQSLQGLFDEAEEHIQERMNELPVNGNYKIFLKEIFNMNEQLFEMLYNHDEENSSKYDYNTEDMIGTVNILAEYQKNDD